MAYKKDQRKKKYKQKERYEQVKELTAEKKSNSN